MVRDIQTTTRPVRMTPWYLDIDPRRRLITGKPYRILKRALDITCCLLILPLALPLMLLLMVLVYIDSPGPIFFSQLRTGKGGRRFKMYKFRTMLPNAEELKLKYAHLNELTWPDFKITNDPRVTKIGKILRKTSMDELPQLFNVLKGEMSIVGPRPTDFGASDYLLWQTERLDFLPGLTGLWQITARGSVNMDERTRMDIAYMERACIALDIVIILKTAWAIIKPKGTT